MYIRLIIEDKKHPGKRANSLKRTYLYILFILIGVIIGIVISNVLLITTGYSLFSNAINQPKPDVVKNNANLTKLAYTVLGYISTGDYYALSRVVHPQLGVMFSPCAEVSFETNKCFQADQIAAFGSDRTAYFWGVHDGNGEPIEMTPENYFSQYVLAKDYSSAPIIGINRINKSGNTLENMMEKFPDIQFVEFHIPGVERDSTEDFSWSSLRLGFEEYEGELWLTLVLNSKWTI